MGIQILKLSFLLKKNFENYGEEETLNINAIGFNLSNNTLVDPLNGLSDGKKKIHAL